MKERLPSVWSGRDKPLGLLASLAFAVALVGCNTKPVAVSTTEPIASGSAKPPEQKVEPVEPETMQAQLAVEAIKTGKTDKEVQEEAAKNEILLDYSAIVKSDGTSGPAYVDPATHKLCWMAFTCKNPKCPGKGKNGKPFLFAYRYPGVVVGADGKSDWSHATHQMTMLDVCPACLKAHTVVPYHDPEEAKRLDKINRNARKVADEINAVLRQGGQPSPELMDQWHQAIGQRGTLPTYYLAE